MKAVTFRMFCVLFLSVMCCQFTCGASCLPASAGTSDPSLDPLFPMVMPIPVT